MHKTTSGDVYNVRDDRRCGWTSARPTTFQNRRADKVTFRDNSIENTFDTGNRRLLRHHRRMDALLNAVRRPFANTEQLDLISELTSVFDVFRRDMTDAFNVNAGEIDFGAKCNAGQYCELMRSVDTIDIEARIGFRVAQLLGFRQHVIE